MGATPDETEIDLRFLVAQLRRNRALLLGSLLIGLMIGGLLHFTATKTFTSHTTLMINIEGEAAASAQAGSLAGSLAFVQSNALAPAYAVAGSSALMEQVVDEENLIAVPEFNGALRELTWKQKIIGAIRGVIVSVKDQLLGNGNEETEAGEEWSSPEEREKWQAISALQRRVEITDMQDDLRLKIAVTTQDRVRSSRIANTIAVKLNKFLNNTQSSALGKALEWLESEAGRVEDEIRKVEEQINAEISVGSVLPGSATLGENAERLVEGELILEANRRRGAALTRLGEVVARIEGGSDAQSAFASMPDDLRSELVTDYVELFRWERRDEPPSRNELLAANNQIKRDLESQASATARREQEILPVRDYTRKLSTAQNRYLQLETNYKANTDLLKTLRERLAELKIKLAGETDRLTVLETALPPLRHGGSSLLLKLAIGSLIGLAIGTALMLFRFFKRNAFLSLEDVEKSFDAPTVSIVSDIQGNLREKFAWVALPNELRESYRRAYSAAFVMPDAQGTQTLMVTSSIPGEGKTTTSIYIAAAAAEEGKKTLLIDLDFRKRSVSRYLGLVRELGVYSVFRNEVTLQEAALPYKYDMPVHQSGKSKSKDFQTVSFDILTTDGRQTSKGLSNRETLSAKNVGDLIEMAKEEYEAVIIDVPPILAVQDANMIGRMVNTIFCVVSTQLLQKKAAQRAAKEWERAGLKLDGLLVRGERNELYEYYDYSYYYYDYAAKEDGRARRPSQRRRKRRNEVGRHHASGGARD